MLVVSLAVLWLFLRIDTQVVMLTAMFTLLALSVSACVTGETHGLNALPKTLNPHGAAILTTINPIAGAIGAAFLSVRPISARNFPAQICRNRQCWTVSIWQWVAL